MNDQGGPDSKNGFVAQVIGNTSLLAAILIYTGWSYLNAQFAYFHLSVISLNISNLDYILHGTFLFIPNIIFVVVLLVIAIVFGCGSFEVSWLRCEDMAVAVSGVVDAFVLAAEVEAPVVLEVAGGDEGAELEDGL